MRSGPGSIAECGEVSRAESDPPQAVRPDWEWRYLASGSGGRVQRVPLLRMTSTDVAAVSFPPVMIIPSSVLEVVDVVVVAVVAVVVAEQC